MPTLRHGAGTALGKLDEGSGCLPTHPILVIDVNSPLYAQFDSLVQTATGFNVAESEAYREYRQLHGEDPGPFEPRPLPMQALDHAAGYLLAFGVNAALCKTVTVCPTDPQKNTHP